MIRLLASLIVLAIGFGAGFYVGIRHRNQQLVDDPDEIVRLYKDQFQKAAADKFEKVKKALTED